MSNWEIPNEFEAFAKVSVPKLVASGEGPDGSLVDCSTLLERSVGSGN